MSPAPNAHAPSGNNTTITVKSSRVEPREDMMDGYRACGGPQLSGARVYKPPRHAKNNTMMSA